VTVADGGFAYPQLNSLKSQQGAFEELQREAQVSLSAPNKDLLFSLTSEETDPGEDAQGCLERTLARMAEDITGFEDSQPVAHPVGEAQGLAVDFSGTLFEQSISGGLIVNTPQSGRCFSAIGMALGSEANELWQGQGQVLFEAILGEVRFFEVARASACPISPDPNYGYSPEAPIRVGNSNLYDGAAREEAYLQSLRGPGGEELRYERLDAIKLEGLAVLDVYELDYTGLENPLILYLDMYTFEPLMLPQGLTCTAPFPLGEP